MLYLSFRLIFFLLSILKVCVLVSSLKGTAGLIIIIIIIIFLFEEVPEVLKFGFILKPCRLKDMSFDQSCKEIIIILKFFVRTDYFNATIVRYQRNRYRY